MDIHDLNNTNLSKIYSKKYTNKKIKEILFDKNASKSNITNITNNTTVEKNQNNSSILNINTSLIDQSKSNIIFYYFKNVLQIH